jgi:hypothetical protein
VIQSIPNRALVARAGPPERNIGLAGKVFGAAVIAIVVHQQEMADPKIAIVFQEIGKADVFVSDRRKEKDIVRLYLFRAINEKLQLPALAKRANPPLLALQSQPI